MALADLDLVFIVGSPRSGTSWLQQMLGSHPEIATPTETATGTPTDSFRKQVGLSLGCGLTTTCKPPLAGLSSWQRRKSHLLFGVRSHLS